MRVKGLIQCIYWLCLQKDVGMIQPYYCNFFTFLPASISSRLLCWQGSIMACIKSVFNKLELKTSFRFIKALLIWGKLTQIEGSGAFPAESTLESVKMRKKFDPYDVLSWPGWAPPPPSLKVLDPPLLM